MATVDPPAEGEMRQFAVALRCRSYIIVPFNEFWALNWQAGTGTIRITVSSEYVAFNPAQTVPTHLVLKSLIMARSANEALWIGQRAATQICYLIALAHNAYISPAIGWFVFETEDTSGWRYIRQIEYEGATTPQIAHHQRSYRPALVARLVASFGSGLDEPQFLTLSRSVAMYVWALEHWSLSLTYRAGHFLYMAAEPLSRIALRLYAKELGKTEDELLEPFLVQAKSREAAIPKGVTKAERAAMLAIFERVGHAGYLGAAKGMLMNHTLRNTIFKDSPDTHDALRKATNGFEHGYTDFLETNELMYPHVDAAASCIRAWILKNTVQDQALVSELTSDELARPLPVARFDLMCKAEFRSTDAHPTRDANTPPFQIVQLLGPNGLATTQVQSLLLPSAGLKNIECSVGIPTETIASEAERLKVVLEQLHGKANKRKKHRR
jgi:hypothetical protein